jgi:hypothetical protein
VSNGDSAAEAQRRRGKTAQRDKNDDSNGDLMERVGRLSAIWLAVLVAAAILAGCDDKDAEQKQQNQDAGGMAIEEKVDEVRREVESFGREVDEAIDAHSPPPDAQP